MMLLLDAVLTGFVFLVPVRSCVIWIFPVCSVGAYTSLLIVVSSESVYGFSSLFMLWALTVLAVCGAHRNEKHVRKEWLSLQQLHEAQELVQVQQHQLVESESLAAGMQTVARALCNIVIKLGPDLRAWG